jgi:hypothetical protein
MKRQHLDAIAAALGLALAAAAMAGMVGTGDYARATAAEARGYQALFGVAQDQRRETGSLSRTVLLAGNEVRQ